VAHEGRASRRPARARSFKAWSKWAGFAMFGLCAGQLIRMLAGRVFRKAQNTAEFEDPFLRNDFGTPPPLPIHPQRASTPAPIPGLSLPAHHAPTRRHRADYYAVASQYRDVDRAGRIARDGGARATPEKRWSAAS
jgi:hypothetical protein